MTHNSGGFQFFLWPSMAIAEFYVCTPWHQRLSLRSRRLEVMGGGKNEVRERDTRVSLARPVLS